MQRTSRIKLSPILGGFIILLISGCSIIYPQYNKPKVDTPANWNSESNLMLNSESNMAYLKWWQQFNDPVLNSLIESGLEFNNNVQIAQTRMEIAKSQLQSINLSFIPIFKLFAGTSTNPALGVPGGFYGIWPGYYSFNIFNTLAKQKSAQLNIIAQEYAINSTKLVLIGQIATSYYTYIAQIEESTLLSQYASDLKEILDIQKNNYTVGIDSKIAIEDINSALMEIKRSQDINAGNTAKIQNVIRYLINENPGTIAQGANFKNINSTYPSFATMPARVLAERPDVNLAEVEYKIATQNIGVAYTSLLPVVQLDYFIGATNALSPQTNIGNSVTIQDAYANWSVNPAIFGDINALKGSKKEAYYHYIDTVKKALRDVDNDLINHNTVNNEYNDVSNAYNAALAKYKLNNNLYQRGIISYAELLQNKIALDKFAIELNQIKLMQMIAIINLYQDLGGGYK